MSDLPDELRALLAEPRERFVAARTERVKALRAAGRRDEAAALAAVRKPSRQVDLLGDLARCHPDAAEAAVQAASDVEAAQAGEGDLHDAMLALRPAIDAVLAVTPARDRGDLGVPLRNLLADEGARADWLAGLLLDLPRATAAPTPTSTGRADLRLVPTGPDVADRQHAGPPPTPIRTRRRPAATCEPSPDEAKAARRVEQARAREEREAAARAARRMKLSAALDIAVSAADAAAHDAKTAAQALARVTDRVAELRRQLDEAEEELGSVGAEIEDARGRRTAADERVTAARAALDEA